MPAIIHTSKGSIDLSQPRVMGILNVTPDSFFDGGRFVQSREYLSQANDMVAAGAHFIDVGVVSTRPGAEEIGVEEEIQRLSPVLDELIHAFPKMLFSIDTYRAKVAKHAIDHGVDIINDISGGRMDPLMLRLVAETQVPYILMHMQGTPKDMQTNPSYVNVLMEVKHFFKRQINKLQQLGVTKNIILDPGFGFGKTLEHNFQLLKGMNTFLELGHPILAGISRKSMINRVLGTSPAKALNGTTVLNTMALMNGARVLRVHDVREALEAVRLFHMYQSI